MARISKIIETGGHHNCITISSNVSDVSLFAIYIINNENKRINIVNTPIQLNGKKIFRYDHNMSTYIEIVIGHQYADDLIFGRDIIVHASLQKFKNDGEFSTAPTIISAGDILSIYSMIQNESSYSIIAELSINVMDHNKNIIESAMAKIPLNNDRLIGHSINERLIYDYQKLDVFVNDSLINPSLYVIEDGFVKMSKNTDGAFVLYRPLIDKIKISDNIYLDGSFNLHVNTPLKKLIEYSIRVTLKNTNIAKINNSPIIKQLALVVAQKWQLLRLPT